MIKKLSMFAALVLFLIVGILLFNSLNRGDFYIDQSSYEGDISTTTKELWFEFNKPIEEITLENQQQHITFSPGVSFVATSSNSRLSILIKNVSPLKSDDYTLSLDLTSQDGDLFKEDIKLRVRYGAGPAPVFEEEQNDSFEGTNPIIKQLPYQTVEYTIDYELPNSNAVATEALTLRISMNFGPSYGLGGRLPNEQEYQAYVDRVIKYRREALDYIQTQGYSLDDFNFIYGETEGLEGFPGGGETDEAHGHGDIF